MIVLFISNSYWEIRFDATGTLPAMLYQVQRKSLTLGLLVFIGALVTGALFVQIFTGLDQMLCRDR